MAEISEKQARANVVRLVTRRERQWNAFADWAARNWSKRMERYAKRAIQRVAAEAEEQKP